MAVEQGYLIEAVEITEDNSNHLEEAIRNYESQTGKILSEEQFFQQVNTRHPLMMVDEMNLAYFFDGHGQRFGFTRASPTEFHISSKSLQKDREILAKYEQGFSDLRESVGQGVLIISSIKVCAILLGVILIVWGVIYTVRKKAKKEIPG